MTDAEKIKRERQDRDRALLERLSSIVLNKRYQYAMFIDDVRRKDLLQLLGLLRRECPEGTLPPEMIAEISKITVGTNYVAHLLRKATLVQALALVNQSSEAS